MYPRQISRASPALQALYYCAMAAALAVWLLPLLAVALTSVRTIEELNRGNIWGWPREIAAVENYTLVFTTTPMAQFILNSLLVSACSAAGAVALSCMAGFALAKYRFRGNLLLLAVFIAGNFVPAQMLMIPVRSMFVNVLGIYDTRLGLVLFHTAFQTGFCTLFMRNFIKQLPDSMIESARTEGASEFAILWHVVLPMVRPAIAAISILTFTFVWNDYFWALVLVHSDAARPVTAGLQAMRGMWLTSWNLVCAAALVTALPPVVLFFLMQKHFIAGLTANASEE